jgi:predicted house-cleaning NTP pyrophosphatase (Maf/HAM1 superfamily)
MVSLGKFPSRLYMIAEQERNEKLQERLAKQLAEQKAQRLAERLRALGLDPDAI